MGLIKMYERWCVKRDLTSKLERLRSTENILDIITFKEVCNNYLKVYPDLVNKVTKDFEEWVYERKNRT